MITKEQLKNVMKQLEEVSENAKRIRAFLQGLSYTNNCKSDIVPNFDNAWHYSDKARMISVDLQSIMSLINKSLPKS